MLIYATKSLSKVGNILQSSMAPCGIDRLVKNILNLIHYYQRQEGIITAKLLNEGSDKSIYCYNYSYLACLYAIYEQKWVIFYNRAWHLVVLIGWSRK